MVDQINGCHYLVSAMTVFVWFPALHIHAIVVIGSLQATAVASAGTARPAMSTNQNTNVDQSEDSPVHLVDHLLGQVKSLLASLATPLHDFALLVQLKQIQLFVPTTIKIFSHHWHTEDNDKCHWGQSNDNDSNSPGGQEIIAMVVRHRLRLQSAHN